MTGYGVQMTGCAVEMTDYAVEMTGYGVQMTGCAVQMTGCAVQMTGCAIVIVVPDRDMNNLGKRGHRRYEFVDLTPAPIKASQRQCEPSTLIEIKPPKSSSIVDDTKDLSSVIVGRDGHERYFDDSCARRGGSLIESLIRSMIMIKAYLANAYATTTRIAFHLPDQGKLLLPSRFSACCYDDNIQC